MKKLIFIDDNQMDHFILKRVLDKYNLAYDVSCTADAEEVVGFLQQNQSDKDQLPDVILLDIYMPKLDGWAFLEKAQRLQPFLSKPLKIYILSSSINPRDIQRSKQFSCVKSFIFKPLTKEVLEKLINDEVYDQ